MLLVFKSAISIILFSTLFIVVGQSSIILAQTNETGILTKNKLLYNNSDLAYSLELPSGWDMQETIKLKSPLMSPTDKAPEIISLTTDKVPANIDLKEYRNLELLLLENQFQNFTLLKDRNATLSGFPANLIVYSYTLNGEQIMVTEIVTLANGRAYNIGYAGIPTEFNDSLSVLLNVIGSLKLDD
jgi:hypothetical protein